MKVQRITDDLRDRIVAGEFPPGGILPTRRILLEHYDVSVAAFQKTINTLIAEGFLESKNSTGVFVRSDPPHLYRLGLALPIYSPAEIQADSLWSALILSVDKFQFEGQPVTLVPYYVNTPNNQGKGVATLQKDAAKKRLCGAMFFAHNSTVVLPEGFPRISFDYDPEKTPEDHIRMATDYVQQFSLAMEEILARGARKVAVIFQETQKSPTLLRFREIAEASGCAVPIEWMLPLNISLVDNIAQQWLIAGLFSDNRKEKPDGIIVMNDNLLPTVNNQLLALGMIPGETIQVVSHCNRPSLQRILGGVSYIGYHAEEILTSCMICIRNYRPGPQPITLISAQKI